MPYREFVEAFPNHNFFVEEIEYYRRSLFKNPFQTYFKVGQFCHTQESYTFEPDLNEEFFKSDSIWRKVSEPLLF